MQDSQKVDIRLQILSIRFGSFVPQGKTEMLSYGAVTCLTSTGEVVDFKPDVSVKKEYMESIISMKGDALCTFILSADKNHNPVLKFFSATQQSKLIPNK